MAGPYLEAFGPEAAIEFDSAVEVERRTNLRALASAGVWILYWMRSRRVRVTLAPRAADHGGTLDDRPPPWEAVPSRGALRLSLALLACLALGTAVSAWPAIRGRVGGDTLNGLLAPGTTPVLPRDIASRARKATVEIRGYDSTARMVGRGTGFFVSASGLLVTNLHVIEDADSLEIETWDGEVLRAVGLVSADARRDIVALKVAARETEPLPVAFDSVLNPGEAVYVMGNPLGQTGTFSGGMVSAHRVIEGVSLVQITAPVSPGSSGGPVMNAFGNVVGVTTLMMRQGQNLNYAVPARYLQPMLARSRPPRPWQRSLVPAADRAFADDALDGDVIESQFRVADSLAREASMDPADAIKRGALRQGGTWQHTLRLTGGREYGIAGYCDNDCSDLDLSLHAPAGGPVGSDTEIDDYPWLEFVAPESGAHVLTVTMVACRVDPCAYGVRLYRTKSGEE
jgi:S1-C subfamily serine protease